MPSSGRERAAEHMVKTAQGAGALERPEIAHFLDDADDRAVAARIGAERAGIDRIDIAAVGADRHALDAPLHGRGAAGTSSFRGS